ncbi:D-3-phosphoglycerate dehydrogenase [Thoreauomyces humboldtii]|nr:D-3-phosphoglycerate dehydrogenase [Thoreauomyces humboldtii]
MSTSHIEILQTSPLHAQTEVLLRTHYTVHNLHDQPDPTAWLKENGHRILGHAGSKNVTSNLISSLPNLQIVAGFGVGYDSVDMAAVSERPGLRVTNTPDVLNDAVAELVVGLMVACARRLVLGDGFVRDGRWTRDRRVGCFGELNGRTVGILGLGRIGKEIATRLQAMKMRVLYHGRKDQGPGVPHVYCPDLVDMARRVDWLVVVAPGGPDTRGIVSREVLEALGPKGSIVNVARGSLVDEEAMIQLLSDGGLGAAALDVFQGEPEVDHRFFALENVVLSPHQGSATVQTRNAMGELMVANLDAHFAGKPLISPVV